MIRREPCTERLRGLLRKRTGVPFALFLLWVAPVLRGDSVALAGKGQGAVLVRAAKVQLVAELDRVAPDLRNALDAGALVTRQVGGLLVNPPPRTRVLRLHLARLLARAQALLGVRVYRIDGTSLGGVYREGMRRVVLAPLPPSAQKALQAASQGTWIAALAPGDDSSAASKRALLYYVEPIFHGGQLRAAAVGVFAATSLGPELQRIADHLRMNRGAELLLTPAERPARSGTQAAIRVRSLPDPSGLVERPPASIAGAQSGQPWHAATGGLLLLLLVGALVGRALRRRAAIATDGQTGSGPPKEQSSSGQQESLKSVPAETSLVLLPPALLPSVRASRPSHEVMEPRRALSIVCIDVIGFRSFAATALPEDASHLVHEIAEIVSALVLRHHGILGGSPCDGMIAIFEAPAPRSDAAQRALSAAEDILRFVQANAPRWHKTYSFEIQLAIGNSTGETSVDASDGESSPEYRQIAEVVSTAAHLATLAQAGQIVSTRQAAELNPELSELALSMPGEPSSFGLHAPFKVMHLL